MNSFTGFTDETFEFFMAIRFNNNRTFFLNNRDWYLRAVREPCIAFAEAMAPYMHEINPDMELRPYRIVSHINRDVRFSKDKSPYRDNMWLSFRCADEEKGTTPSFYFEINDSGACYGMGFWRGCPELMKNYRAWLLKDPDEAYNMLSLGCGGYRVYLEEKKRMQIPDGLNENLRSFYRSDCLFFEKQISDFSIIKSSKIVSSVQEGFDSLLPVYKKLRSFKNPV